MFLHPEWTETLPGSLYAGVGSVVVVEGVVDGVVGGRVLVVGSGVVVVFTAKRAKSFSCFSCWSWANFTPPSINDT